jgi:hypothetical protein
MTKMSLGIGIPRHNILHYLGNHVSAEIPLDKSVFVKILTKFKKKTY